MNIYLDMDGVLADFDAGIIAGGGVPVPHVKARSAMTPAELKADDKIISIMGAPDFFARLPVLKGADRLLEAVALIPDADICILSAVPGEPLDSASCIDGKYRWLRQHAPLLANRAIFCRAREKQDYANSDAILIDDHPRNCSEWRERGGVAIQHHDIDDTLARLRSVTRKIAA